MQRLSIKSKDDSSKMQMEQRVPLYTFVLMSSLFILKKGRLACLVARNEKNEIYFRIRKKGGRGWTVDG